MLTTLRFKDNETLYACYLPDLDFKIENEELAIYKDSKFLGFFNGVIGMSEEDFVKYVENYLTERNIEVK